MKKQQFEELKQLFRKSRLLKGKDKGYRVISNAVKESAML